MPNKTAMHLLWTNVMTQASDFYIAKHRKCLKSKMPGKLAMSAMQTGISNLQKLN
jgi:hypothetical protein